MKNVNKNTRARSENFPGTVSIDEKPTRTHQAHVLTAPFPHRRPTFATSASQQLKISNYYYECAQFCSVSATTIIDENHPNWRCTPNVDEQKSPWIRFESKT